MMDGTFVKELDERFRTPHLVTDNVIAAPPDWKLVDPETVIKPGPAPVPLGVATLGALRDYLVANRDDLDRARLAVHVVSPQTVRVISELEDRAWARHAYLEATAANLADGFFGQYHQQEEFIVGMQTRFAESEGRAAVLRVIGLLKNQVINTSSDDGITQTVETRAGIVLATEREVPNPILLTPYRTFREVTQPESWCVLRVRVGRPGGVAEIGLFEADGGAWRLTATERIADWLRLALVEALPADVHMAILA